MEKEMVMGRELVITTNLSNFDNVPNIGGMKKKEYTTKLYTAKIPTNITIGTTYYTLLNGNLIAFKIRAYSFTQSFAETTTWCLVETPNETTWSCAILQNHIFASVEDYYKYISEGEGKIKIEYRYFTNLQYLNENKGFELRKTYYWNRQEQRPKTTSTRLYYVLVTDTKVYVGIDYKHNQYADNNIGYASGEDCIKANINGMKIIEFSEPNISFTLHIEEPKEPKIRVLRFID